MRFGTKILLLLLSVTIGLSGIVVLVLRSEMTRRESDRALSRINSAAERYFKNLDRLQEQVSRTVLREMHDPNNRSMLDALSPEAADDDRAAAVAQLAGPVFSIALQTDLSSQELGSATFHALVNRAGRCIVAAAVDDPYLEQSIRSPDIAWNIEQVLHGGRILRNYLWIDSRLYLIFGVPLQQTSDEDPTYAYFAGYRVTDDLVNRLLDYERDEVQVASWFIVDAQVVARGSDTRQDAGSPNVRVTALLSQVRPDAAAEQRHDVRFTAAGERFLGQYTTFEPAPNVRGVLALASSLDAALIPLRALQRKIALVTLAGVLLAVVLAGWISRRIARPVEQLVAGTQRIADGVFTETIEVNRRDELGELARSFNEMARGLAQRDLIKDTLGQFVDPRIADTLLTNPASLRGQRAVQTVLFSDLEKFTMMSEKSPPEQLVHLLNAFLSASADVVKELNGYLDKFSGDGVVAFWGPPVEQDHAAAACRAALRMVELSHRFDDDCRRLGVPPLRIRIGIATGEVIIGIIGSERSKKNYTAMGDVVNLASRLEGVNKEHGTQILIDAVTAAAVGADVVTRCIGVAQVRGREQTVEVYEVLGLAPTVTTVPHSGQRSGVARRS